MSREVREDGHPYVTPVVRVLTCENCGGALELRAEGRTPRFCSPACRVAWHRAHPKLRPERDV